MSKAFVERFIVTKDDGHDFYPYNGIAPSFEEVKEYMLDNMIEIFSIQKDRAANQSEAASIAAIEKQWRLSDKYRERCIAEAAEYIMDIEFEDEDDDDA